MLHAASRIVRHPLFTGAALFLTLSAASPAPAQEGFAAYPPLPPGVSSIKVFDIHGRFSGRILPERRYWVPIDRIPAFLQQALVAVEDSRFYDHNGIDVRGIARALVKDVVKGRLAEGGSTITQQLIKNKHLSAEKTIDRKVKEGLLALEYERTYTKKQILEMYFNEIYYGNGAWGIAQAARLYFDKNPEELTEGECALLAGVPKSPGRYNPMGDPKNVTARRDIVLKRMLDLKMITQQRYQGLRKATVPVMQAAQAPYYMAHIKSRLVEKYGPQVIEQGGLEVTAAMDLTLQKLAEQSLRDGVKKVSPDLQGAIICLDTATGDVLAAAGGVDYAKSAYNRAFLARRQPGSTIKPLVYAAALEAGITPSSLWSDTPVAYSRGNGETWKPLNYGGEQYGELSLRQALAHSSNVVTVKLLETIGVPALTDFAGKVGLPLKGTDLSLALGTEEATLSDMVLAYAPFANGGLRPEPRTIVRIYDRNRRTWTENPPLVTPVISPATAFVTTQMLKDVLVYGTGKRLKSFAAHYPSAGKTGTTSDYRDAWFIGYTPGIITGVWVGHDRPKPGGRGFTGGAVAAPIWETVMRGAVAGKPAVDFAKPEGVVTISLDPATGSPVTAGARGGREEYFLEGTEPGRTTTEDVVIPDP